MKVEVKNEFINISLDNHHYFPGSDKWVCNYLQRLPDHVEELITHREQFKLIHGIPIRKCYECNHKQCII